jgi:hypothetical protein
MERYMVQVQILGYQFIGFLAEAFGLPPDALACFYEPDVCMQHRSKVGVILLIFNACISYHIYTDCQVSSP